MHMERRVANEDADSNSRNCVCDIVHKLTDVCINIGLMSDLQAVTFTYSRILQFMGKIMVLLQLSIETEATVQDDTEVSEIVEPWDVLMVGRDSWLSVIYISMEKVALGFCNVHFSSICLEVLFKPMEVVLGEKF